MNRARMQFADASAEQLSVYNGDKGAKAVLVVSTRLTPELAKALKCEYVFQPNGDPQPTYEGGPLDIKLRDCDLALPTGTDACFQNLRPELIHKFRIQRPDDLKLVLGFRAHFTSNVDDVYLFFKNLGKNNFECAIVAAQGEFDFSGDDVDLGGTQVNMSGAGEEDGEDAEDEEPLCAHCEGDVPLNSEGLHMLPDGVVVPCKAGRKAEAGEEMVSALADARSLTGGKTPGRNPKRRTRQPDPSVAAEVESSVTVQ